jgi:hypothetical protein
MKKKKNLLPILLIILVITIALFFFTRDKNKPLLTSHDPNNSSVDIDLLKLVASNKVHIFDALVTKKLGDKIVNSVQEQQFQVEVHSSVDGTIKPGSAIITIPNSAGLKVDKYSHSFIGVFDSKNNWYDTTYFQKPYHVNGQVINKIGYKTIAGVKIAQYKISVESSEYISRSITGDITLDVTDFSKTLKDGKKYSLYMFPVSPGGKEFVNVYAGLPMIIDVPY